MHSLKLISFHPKLAAGLDCLFSSAMIWWIFKLTNPWLLIVWFLFRVIWWAALVQCMYYPPFVNRYKHLVSLIFFNLGLLAFLVFVDARFTADLLVLIFVLLPAVTFWLVPEKANALSIIAKPQRRARFLMSGVGLAGGWSGGVALIVFQITSG